MDISGITINVSTEIDLLSAIKIQLIAALTEKNMDAISTLSAAYQRVKSVGG